MKDITIGQVFSYLESRWSSIMFLGGGLFWVWVTFISPAIASNITETVDTAIEESLGEVRKDTNYLSNKITSIQDGQETTDKELEEIKQLLQSIIQNQQRKLK